MERKLDLSSFRKTTRLARQALPLLATSALLACTRPERTTPISPSPNPSPVAISPDIPGFTFTLCNQAVAILIPNDWLPIVELDDFQSCNYAREFGRNYSTGVEVKIKPNNLMPAIEAARAISLTNNFTLTEGILVSPPRGTLTLWRFGAIYHSPTDIIIIQTAANELTGTYFEVRFKTPITKGTDDQEIAGTIMEHIYYNTKR